MTSNKSFHDYIVSDLLRDIPGISSRAMFGGWALYKDRSIFGIVIDAELYFKVDDGNRAQFERANSRPFTYAKRDGKSIVMSYWLVPAEFMEDKEVLNDLVEKSVAASQKQKP
ncbi:MAG: TfoX/Sxy family protein [Actinomycetota bacterium]